MDEQTKQQIREAVEDAFSASVKDGRYIDISRVPLICQSIVQIGKDISNLKETAERHSEKLDAKVSPLEIAKNKQDGFNKAVAIFGSVAWVVVFALVTWMLTQILDTKSQLQLLNSKLSAYEVEIK